MEAADTAHRVTEILDVATLDIFAGLSKDFTNNFPSELVSDQWKKEALDVEFHWVNETGKDATLTAGITLKPTVCSDALLMIFQC